jgi:hypothetical protein
LVLPALVEAGFQENPMARIFVFGERQSTLGTPNNKYWVVLIPGLLRQ